MTKQKLSPLAPRSYTRHWPTNREQHAYLRSRRAENYAKTKTNSNELWMYGKLKQTGLKWTRQATWGYRIFDFWCQQLGIAVEVDGQEHNATYDSYRDEANYFKSGIRVLRVRNRNEEDAARVLHAIARSENWTDRRLTLGLKPIKAIPPSMPIFTIDQESELVGSTPEKPARDGLTADSHHPR